MPLTLNRGFWTGAAGGGSDPYWSSVQFLQNWNAANLSPELSDNSFTLSGDTTSRNTTNTLFSSAASFTSEDDATLDGAGQGILSFPTAGAVWTLEGFLYPAQVADSIGFVSSYNSSGGQSDLKCSISGEIYDSEIYIYIFTTTSYPMATTTFKGGTLSADNWYFFAFVADGTNMSLYLGLKSGTTASRIATASQVTMNDKDEFRISGITNSLNVISAKWDGQIEDLRITDGIARYSGSSLTIPTSTFPTQ